MCLPTSASGRTRIPTDPPADGAPAAAARTASTNWSAREDIAKRLWAPDVFTDVDAGIHTAILKIRQALGDSRESPRFVETVAGKGYRFVGARRSRGRSRALRHRPVLSGGGRTSQRSAQFADRAHQLYRASGRAARSVRRSRVDAAAVVDGSWRRREDPTGDAARVRCRASISQMACGWSIWRRSRHPTCWLKRSRPRWASAKDRSDRCAKRCLKTCAIVSCCWCSTTAST